MCSRKQYESRELSELFSDDLLFLQTNYIELYAFASSFKMPTFFKNFKPQIVKLTQHNENAQTMNDSFIYVILITCNSHYALHDQFI
jgi:hypothetical protein